MEMTTATTLREILRRRPRAVEVLAAASGTEYWHHLDQGLEEFASELGLDAPSLLGRIAALPVDPAETGWSDVPLCRLLDKLVRDHDDYRDRVIPDIERLLSSAGPADFPETFPVETARREFHSFKVDFLLHMEEEEEFLFPKALRTEASAGCSDLPPESYTGSVSAYSGTLIHFPDLRIKEMIVELRRRVAESRAPGTGSPFLPRLESALEGLERSLLAHADLEIEVLMRRTLELERRTARREG